MASIPPRKRLTYTFNRAVFKPWEEFEILMPSSESDGYTWQLRQQDSKPFEIRENRQFPEFEPRARCLVLAGSQYGQFEVKMELAKEIGPGQLKVRESRKFNITIR
jgi:hypothetical protein